MNTNRIRLFRLPILAGLLIGTSYIPFPPWALFFCLTPLLLFWKNETSVRRAFFAGWLTQFLLNLIGFHWVAHTVVEFGHMPWIVGLLVLLLFCATAHLYYAIAGGLGVWLKNRFQLSPPVFLFLVTCLFAILELSLPVLFPWHLGYPWLWGSFPGAQTADLIGFEGLNIVTLLINASLAVGFYFWREQKRTPQAMISVLPALLVFVVIHFTGINREKKWQNPDREIKVLVVQGNIGNLEKIMAEKGAGFQDEIVETYSQLTLQGLKTHPEAEVVLWPETAFPDYLDAIYSETKNSKMLREKIATQFQRPLWTGAYSNEPGATKSQDRSFNGFFILGPDGEVALPPYRKTVLLAYGEYFPIVGSIPFLVKQFPILEGFGRGPGPSVLDWNGIKVGPQICYEGLYPYFSAGLNDKGAELIVNVTNDSWFATHFEPHQHLYMTLARAIEFRRPLLRATNTGITTAILADGQILEKSPQNKPWYGLYKIPYQSSPPVTLYQKIHGLWIYVLAIACGLLLFFGRGRTQKSGLA